MTTTPQASSTAIPKRIRQSLRHAALQRNLRTAAVVGVAASGGLVSTAWLTGTIGLTFSLLLAWRLAQERQPKPKPQPERAIR